MNSRIIQRLSVILKKLSTAILGLIAFSFLISPAQASVNVNSVVVDVDFTSASLDGSGKIPNAASGRLADLTPIGSPSGLGTTDGITFANTTSSVTAQYLTGNLGTTTDMSKITVEFTAKFPDSGCALQASGSMIFSLGVAGNYVSYNIYRHSNFIGLNTFNSDIYGAAIPDQTNFHTYKIVMVPNPTSYTLQELWIDGVSKPMSYQTTTNTTENCSAIRGTGETSSARIFTNGTYTSGDFMFMTHALGANTWRTSGTVKNLKISTTVTLASPVIPSAPTISGVTAGDSQLSVAFTAGSDGGAQISDYKYSTDNGSTWTSAGTTTSPITITGLTNGTAYNVKLRAVNSVGDGTASSASSGTPKGNQVVSWSPTNNSALTTASPLTPNQSATTNGNGVISYAVQNAGTTGCTVNASTGVLTFSTAGSCVIRATAASTTSFNSGYKDVTFTITEPTSSPSPTSNETSSASPASTTPVAATTISLGASIGQPVAGSVVDVTADGLKANSDYSLVVRSTPKTLASGTTSGSSLALSAKIPSGLEAGWHSLTFSSTASNGNAVVSTLYFEVSSKGTLVQSTGVEPAEHKRLAKTGADVANQIGIAVLLLIVGFSMLFGARKTAFN